MSKVAFKVADGLLTPRNMIIAGILIGLAIAFGRWWDIIEPVTGVVTLLLAASAAWQTRQAKEARYVTNDNRDDRWVVALEVGRPIAEAANAQFDHVDVHLRVEDIIGTNTLVTEEHYEQVAKAVYRAIAQSQNREIDLIVSGPNALNVIIGQLLGMENFNVTVWQWFQSRYERVPRPTRDWLEHR